MIGSFHGPGGNLEADGLLLLNALRNLINSKTTKRKEKNVDGNGSSIE